MKLIRFIISILMNVTCSTNSLRADINARTKAGSHALHLAASCGSLNCLERLYDAKVEDCPIDNLLRTPLHLAAMDGDVRCVKYLILKTPSALKMKDAQGLTPLDCARKRGCKEAEKILEVMKQYKVFG